MNTCRNGLVYVMTFFILISLLITAVTPASSFSVRQRYILNTDGTATIFTVVENIVDESVVKIRLERNYVEESLVAFSSEGMPLPTTTTPEGEVVLEVHGLDNVTIEYVARVGELISDIQINALISPIGPAEVVLPLNSALLYFNGSPQVGTRGDASGKYTYVILKFSSGGHYEVNYLVLPTAETKPTTPPTTPATTPATTPPPKENITEYLVMALLVVALLMLIIYFIVRRRFTGQPIEPSIETGLDDRDKAILKALSEGEVSLTDLSKITKLNKSVVWRRLERLRNLGYVDKGYSRGMSVYRLTPKGIKLLKELSE